GIRDATVTGVQTCALPISPPGVRERPGVDRQTALLCDRGHFRSNPAAPVDDCAEDIEGEHLEIRFGRHADLLTLCQLEVGAVDRDRKSTRLNSTHGSTSYA